jgi:hypothetical protein
MVKIKRRTSSEITHSVAVAGDRTINIQVWKTETGGLGDVNVVVTHTSNSRSAPGSVVLPTVVFEAGVLEALIEVRDATANE